ncbi:signal transduction histidine kinase [Pelomonas saccharophila]|uniref:Signal transduction histidine kinase n=1 Tax=Roseateles saccharophilus TaxID=304 RepID=A0ABU1YW01_ROSSA|nr:histidine kinase [Roseateles saccharophilus]MDR7272908.1 signal transduction histidine kinase [Roseateles saccharophilus]
MTKFDRLLARLAEPGVVLRLAALVVCAMELVSAGAALFGARTEPYDGLVAWVWRAAGGGANDRGLLLLCVGLLLAFVALMWRLASQGGGVVTVNRRLAWLLLVDLLAFGVTPGLPFLVTALAAVLLPARLALGFGFAQVLLNTGIYAAPQATAWLDQFGLLSSMLALHGLAFGLGRMAAAEAEKRRWLQAVLAEQMAGEHLLVEQMRYSERMQIARELHDLMGHHLTALNLQLQLGGALLARADTPGAGQALGRAEGVAAQLLADVREAVSQQRSSQRIDLSAALQALAEGIASTRIELALDDAARDLGPRAAHALLRCVQEGVTNSVRHASARRVQVELRGEGDEIAVSIDDDGRGAPNWPAGRAEKFGNGLSGMAERMTELGGQMCVTRTSPGFRIELRCPRWV